MIKDVGHLKGRNSLGKTSFNRGGFIVKLVVVIVAISVFGFLLGNAQIGSETKLCVIAYNVYGGTGWPKENPKAQSVFNLGQMPKLIAQELALYTPDIINFSESPEEHVVKEIADLLKMNYVFFSSGGNWPGALLTRFEIIQSSNAPTLEGSRPEKLFTRHWGRAVVRLPDRQSIVVHSAHLFPHDNPKAAGIRKKEIAEILKVIKQDALAGYPIVIMGDLNHTPQMPEYMQWIKAGCTDTFTQAGHGEGLTIKSDEPTKRIDYVLTKGYLKNRIMESRSLFEGAFRTNPSDSNSFALSDHLPQLAVFELDK